MTNRDLLLQVARLSFVEGKKNRQIAAILRPEKPITDNTNLSWVQELIDEAGQWLLDREQRLEEIEATDTTERHLEDALRERFSHLVAVRVVPGGEVRDPSDYAALLKKYARAAADYFDQVANDAEDKDEELYVAVSGGQPILDMVSALPDRKRPNVHYYAAALIGRGTMMRNAPHVGSEANATIAWSRSGRLPGQLYYGTVSPYDVSAEDVKGKSKRARHDFASKEIIEQKVSLLGSPDVIDILRVMNENVNVAFAGLGIPHATGEDAQFGIGHTERLTMTGLLKPFGIDPQLLMEDGAVGDLSYTLFQADGMSKPEWQFFITAGEGSEHTGIDFYRNLVSRGGKVIVIGGVRKEAALRPALKTRMFNVWVTDSVTAQLFLT